MQELYIVRHGPAVNIGEQGVTSDVDRMLSEEGRDKTEKAARGFATLDCTPDSIISSPLIRARETAEIFAACLGNGNVVELSDELCAGAVTEMSIRWLGQQVGDRVMLVGHMPQVADWVSNLVTGYAHTCIQFKKAAVCKMSFDGNVARGEARLDWLMQPAELRALAP